MGIVGLVVTGSGIGAAVAASTASIPATIFNAVFMAVAVSLLYVPVKQIYTENNVKECPLSRICCIDPGKRAVLF